MVTRIEIVPIVARNRLVTDVYRIDKEFSRGEIRKIVTLLTNPLVQKAYVNRRFRARGFSRCVEIGFLPGVTDNVATTTKEMIADLLAKPFIDGEGVYTSRVYYLQGGQEAPQYNPLIAQVVTKDTPVPKVELSYDPKVTEVNLAVADSELVRLGKVGISGPLALDLASMKTIRAYFQKKARNPTDIELESIAQTWSEHCKHTIMNSPIDDIPEGLFHRFIRGATERIRKQKGKRDFCVSVFSDNSGAINFDGEYAITHKVETHNSPSALDPFGGAVTGIVGVNRDCLGFGLGAKPIMNMYGFCLGLPDDTKPLYRDKERTERMLPPRRIFDGVVAGVNSGGNCSGIPTPQGFVYFDDRYKGKPLVFVGTVGLIPIKLVTKRARPGDYIVMVGGRVGLDGIHGATFSSEALTSGSPATAVQIGDPITQKKLSDAIVKEARDQGLFHSITDNGAGGLSCSVAEMAKESGGCMVELEKVPLKYPGLSPWQIWVSESQERMTLAVPPNKWESFRTLMNKRGVEATVIGKFTKSGKCVVSYRGIIVMDVDMKFLHNGLPVKLLVTKVKPKRPERALDPLNFVGFSFISQQYDHEVQGTSVLKPIQGRGRVNADAVVLRPILSSNRGIVSSHALYPSYAESDPYAMAAAAIDTAIRNVVCAGADPEETALLDNFCWCDSNNHERLWQLKEAARACYDYARHYGTPYISGKDSMFNDFHGFDAAGTPVTISIPPTLLISALGIIADVRKAVSLDAKIPGDVVYVLGDPETKKNKKLYQAVARCIEQELVASAQSVHHGGVKFAIIKTALGGMLGVDCVEGEGTVLVTVAPKNLMQFERELRGNEFSKIGTVTTGRQIHFGRLHTTLEKAREDYEKPFASY